MIVLWWNISVWPLSQYNASATHGRKSEAPYTKNHNSERPVSPEWRDSNVNVLGVVIAMLLMHQRMIFQSKSASVICRS